MALATTTAGCGLGPGDSSPGTATLTVTHDYGAQPVLEASESDPSESETVIRFLDREADITTRYGGGFVQSINGTAGSVADGRAIDWFFFVNGIESPRGGAEVDVRGGDRIWWDYRDWTAAISTPAVVGSWPEPFLQASTDESERLAVDRRLPRGGRRLRPRLGLARRRRGRRTGEARHGRRRRHPRAGRHLGEAALRRPRRGARRRAGHERGLRPFRSAGPAAGACRCSIRPGPRPGRWGAGAGLVAGMRHGTGPVTWVVTGTDAAGVDAAAGLLGADDLAQRYAVATDGATALRVPHPEGG